MANELQVLVDDNSNAELCWWCSRPLPILDDGIVGDCPKCHPESYTGGRRKAEYHLIICPYCNGKIRVNPAGDIAQ